MQIFRGQILENSAITLVARVRDTGGALLVPSGTSSVIVNVWDTLTRDRVVTINPGVNDTIMSSLQLDELWDADEEGYNVRIPMSGTYFPEGNRMYRVEVKIDPTATDPVYVVWELQTIEVFSE